MSAIGAVARAGVRAVVGFPAVFVLAWLAFFVLAGAPRTHDVSTTELDQARRMLRAVTVCASLAGGTGAVLAACVGGRPVPQWSLRFAVAWGAIAVFPIWPHKGAALLPFGAFYAHLDLGSPMQLLLTALHLAVASAGAWIFGSWQATKEGGAKPAADDGSLPRPAVRDSRNHG
jgi:hypothetical protein